jgi:hypothetical protein
VEEGLLTIFTRKASNMQTSKEWWEKIKADEEAFRTWLMKQYIGEVTASFRIQDIAARTESGLHKAILARIASDEKRHATWIGGLLDVNGIYPPPKVDREKSEQRYWKETGINSTDNIFDLFAIGAHAESMRLERIRTIVEDVEDPRQVRGVFGLILPDEQFHAAAFELMAGPQAMARTLPNHQRGLEVLGLEI